MRRPSDRHPPRPPWGVVQVNDLRGRTVCRAQHGGYNPRDPSHCNPRPEVASSGTSRLLFRSGGAICATRWKRLLRGARARYNRAVADRRH